MSTYKFRFIVKDSNSNIIEDGVRSLEYDTEVTFHEVSQSLSANYQDFIVESCKVAGQDVLHSDVVLDSHRFMAITIKLN